MVWYRHLSVQLPFLLYQLSFVLQDSVLINLYVYRTCYTIFGYNESDCAQLGTVENNFTAWIEEEVEVTVNDIKMVESITKGLIPITFSLFVGSWSDKFGKKPFMILSFAGPILSTAMFVIMINFSNLSTWWFLMSSIPSLLIGGFSTLFNVFSSHIADITTGKDRMISLGILEVIVDFSSVVGAFISPYLFNYTNYQGVFLISLGLLGGSLLYTIFFVSENLKTEKKAFSVEEILSSMNFKEIAKHIIRKRENNARYYIFWIIGIYIIYTLSLGEMNVRVMFLRNHLHWTFDKYTQVHSISNVSIVFGTLFGTLILHKKLKCNEMSLCLLGLTLFIIVNLLYGVATNNYYIYTAKVISAFNDLPQLMLYTTLSFIVSPEEMGKIFALLGIIVELFSMLSSLIHLEIYNATIHINSGIYSFVSAGIKVLAAMAVLLLSRQRIPRYNSPEKEEEQKGEPEKIRKVSMISVIGLQGLDSNENRSNKEINLEVNT